jgi:hypothetical protein
MVHRGAAGPSVMDEHQQLLKQRAPLLPTSIPNGLDEVFGSIRSSRQTRQVQQRIGHEHQTPMCSNGFGTPHAGLVEAQLPLAVLLEGFCRPALPRQANDLGGAPVHPVRDQHDRTTRQLFGFKTHDNAHLAQAGEADPQRQAPKGVLADVERAIALAGISGPNSSTAIWGPGSFRGQPLASRT